MKEFPVQKVRIIDPFWSPRLQTNAEIAIFHQWEQLEKSGCIDNFRIVAGEKQGFREGWVFADSDAYKWLEAAARIYAGSPQPELKGLMDYLITLLARAQLDDGYIYTFNQYHFPDQRWVNLQVEHELYCLGHLIEAGVSHFEATGETVALDLAIKAADLLVHSFTGGPPERTEGHQEVEIALMRLHLVTGNADYLNLAQHLIEIRGRIRLFPLLIRRENASHAVRKLIVNQRRAEYAAHHPEYAVSKIPPDNYSKEPPFSKLRRKLNSWRGYYNQQHAPVRQQTIPVGHAVRYGYFQTATTMLYRLRGDSSLLPALKQSWERLVTRRMYVTGGLGSLPGNEGFGFDYELDPEFAYNETCAALASLFWNWEMALVTGDARYSDLFEWQLYNAALVGLGLKSDTYLYNNPLAVHGGITRKAWYSVPCCPPNLLRTWANLGKYIYSIDPQNIWVHQYFGNIASPESELSSGISIESALPYAGSAIIRLNPAAARLFNLNVRIPSWCLFHAGTPAPHTGQAQAFGWKLSINGDPYLSSPSIPESVDFELTAQGYDPRLGAFLSISRTWKPGDVVKLDFEMPIILRHAHPWVRDHAGKAALTRGPLVYCLESTDNPGLDIFTTRLNPATLFPEELETELGRITVLRGESTHAEPLTFIPYHLWANRGPSQMTVWVNVSSGA